MNGGALSNHHTYDRGFRTDGLDYVEHWDGVGAGILRALRIISKSNGTSPVFQKPLRIPSGVKAIFWASTKRV